MTQRWLLVLVGIATFMLFLLVSAPAAKVLPWLEPQLPQIHGAGISGSIWSGGAQQLSVGSVPLTDVRWHLRPLALFKGALEVAMDARLNDQPVRANLGRGVFSGAYLSDVTGRMAAADLLFMTGLNLAELGGEMDFDIQRVVGLGQGFPAVAGTLSWAPAQVLAPLQLDLGKAQLTTRIEAGETRGQLTASGGALTLAGDVSFNPDGSYRLVGQVQKHGAVPQAVDKFLTTFAEFNNGSYRLEWSDQIKF